MWPNSGNAGFVEDLYTSYLEDPNSVSPEWQDYFRDLTDGDAGSNGNGNGSAHTVKANAVQKRPAATAPISTPLVATTGPLLATTGHDNGAGYDAGREIGIAALQDRVDQMIRAYRVRGHMMANLDPLGLAQLAPRELEPEFYGFTDADMDRPFSTRTIEGAPVRTLRGIIDRLRNTYCRSIGVQFMHIDDFHVRHWLQERMEGSENRLRLGRDEQLRVLARLTDATIFEEFIQKKYVGAKRFSLEGAETLIPALDVAIEKAGAHGVETIIMAMAHRGRLNVLANVMGKSPNAIFREFDDPDPELHMGRGDVKYHLGYSNDWVTASGRNVHLSLCFNPSHLEFVNPVALGRLRAKQDRMDDQERSRGLCILVHGDASFAGQGVIQETLNLSQLHGYSTGGTLHFIVNNQIGFTTTPREARSNTYATAVAKMLQIPIFHVNGEDPEAVAQCVQLSLDFRQLFKRDVVIDMYCYRKYGHNEGDEPKFTQPLLYQAIERRKPVREGYMEHLLEMGGITLDEADKISERRRAHLVKELSVARSENYLRRPEMPNGLWARYYGGPDNQAEDVGATVSRERLSELLMRQTELPSDFTPHRKISRWLDNRKEMASGQSPIDWAAAEALAFGSLLIEGHPIRLSGQDCQRGTFSHRHTVLHDMETGATYTPLAHLEPEQAEIEILNSPLSEVGVLGFEYGYSLDRPEGLVIWEAQFGDFVNVAQVIIDQFIASAEDKWRRLSGLIMMLPHGFEGMGPEHSSGRLERFMTLAAEDNFQVVNATTPAQYYHVLRRQAIRPWRKPLIMMTPKSLLRHPRVVSSLEELASGGFRRILPDEGGPRQNVERVLICSGKIYYELEQARQEREREDVAILRFEQLYPLPDQLILEALAPYAPGTPVYWVQEEPENMGAWGHFRIRFGETILGRYPFRGVCRAASASPATGSASSHKLEQEQLITRAFTEG